MEISMTQEERKLLLKDLCARIPYGVKFQSENIETALFVDTSDDEVWINGTCIDDFKPYLFPLSSLTKEQRNIISNKIREIQINNPPFGKIHDSGTDNLLNNITLCAQWLINYYIENHFDYNGLIEKGLAIDATELNIY